MKSCLHPLLALIVLALGAVHGFVAKTSTSTTFVVKSLSSTVSLTNPRASSSRPTEHKPLQSFFGEIFGQTEKKAAPATARKFESVTIDPDFRCGGGLLVAGLAFDTIPYIQWTLGPFTTLLGVLFLVQAARIRFVFDESNSLEVCNVNLSTGELEDSGENFVVGGANKWNCDTIINYDFFPKGWIDTSPTGPVLVYFKETQTPEQFWNDGPGKAANDPGKVSAGLAVPGQVHFFPCICNAQKIRKEFEKRNCGKI